MSVNLLENEIEDPKADFYEQLEESFSQDTRGGGSGKKRKPDSNASKHARQLDRDNAQEKRKLEAEDRIKKVFKNFPKKESEEGTNSFIDRYVLWVKASLDNKYPVVNADKDFEFSATRSSGPGGQNVNKVNSAVRCVHTYSGIKVVNQESRDQPVNKNNAVREVYRRVEEHIKDWQVYSKPLNEINRELILDLMTS